jgi:hypothetical protein
MCAMQRARITFAAAAVVATGVAALTPTHPASAPSATRNAKPLYGIVGEWRRDARLARLDPRSLRPLRGRKLEILDFITAWGFSPDRSRIALGTACQAGVSLGTLQLVDLRRMRSIGCYTIGGYSAGAVAAVAWLSSDRLLVVTHSPFVGVDVDVDVEILVIDSGARRVIDRTPLEGVALTTARAGDRLVVLTGRTYYGEARRVLVADARGGIRFVDIEVPSAGALVVEPSGRRAYLVSADTVAEVDLDTLAVAYHGLSEQKSMLGRFLAWLVPAAEAKIAPREIRGALWLGDGVIASFGSNVTIDGHTVSSVPLGLRLIDTRTWRVRTVDEQVSSAFLAGDVLLATGAKEIGLVAYDRRGAKRFQLFRGQSPVVPIESYETKVWVNVGRRPVLRVVDVRTRRVLGPRRAPLPTLLVER